MKLTKLTREEMAHIAVALSEFALDLPVNDYGEAVITQIGQRLDIDAVYGEGYDTTVWRVCRLIINYEPLSSHERIIEALSNINVEGEIMSAVGAGRYDDAIKLLEKPGQPDWQAGAADSIRTIIKQHQTTTKED